MHLRFATEEHAIAEWRDLVMVWAGRALAMQVIDEIGKSLSASPARGEGQQSGRARGALPGRGGRCARRERCPCAAVRTRSTSWGRGAGLAEPAAPAAARSRAAGRAPSRPSGASRPKAPCRNKADHEARSRARAWRETTARLSPETDGQYGLDFRLLPSRRPSSSRPAADPAQTAPENAAWRPPDRSQGMCRQIQNAG